MTPEINLDSLRVALGGKVYDGGRRWVGPGPGHSARDCSLSVMVSDQGKVVWHSFAGDPQEAVWAHLGLSARQEARQSPRDLQRLKDARNHRIALERAHKLEFCRTVWESSLCATGSPVERYLAGRAILGPVPDALRYHPAAPLGYDWRATSPAMVAIVTGPNGAPCGLHVTAIKADGSGKAAMVNPRRMFGDIAGGAVRLSLATLAGRLAIGEGLETSLAFGRLHGLPVWAALSTSGLSRFVPPAGVRELIIAADSDDSGAGIAAAQALATACRRQCTIVIASAPAGNDWADVLMEGSDG